MTYKRSKCENKGIVPTKMELELEQTQQGSSHEVSDYIEMEMQIPRSSIVKFIATCSYSRLNDFKTSRENEQYTHQVFGTAVGELNLGGMMGGIDISTLTLEQYFRMIDENHASGMVNNECGRTMEKKIEDMIIAEYMKYKAKMKRQLWRDSKSYLRTKYDSWDVGSFHLEKNKTLDYPYYIDDAKIDAYYNLPPLLPCFKTIQPYIQRKNESYKVKLDDEINYMSDRESVISEQGTIDNTDAPEAPNLKPHDEGMSSDDDVDEWFVAEMEEHTKRGENKEDTLINIMKSLVKECKPFLVTIHAQIDVFNGEISFGTGEDRVKFNVNGNSHHSNATLEKFYMETEKESFNPLEIEDDLFSYESPACLRFEQNTIIHTNSDIETIDSPSNTQEISERSANHQPDNKKDTSRWHVCKPVRVFYDNGSGEDCRIWPTCNLDISFCSECEAVYRKDGHGMLKQWDSPHDDWHTKTHTNYKIGRSSDQSMPTTTRGNIGPSPRRHPKTDLGKSMQSKPIEPPPCDYSFEEWLKVKIGHTSIGNYDREKLFNEWVLDSFDVEADKANMFANPYSRIFDEYMRIFINEVEQLSNEYELKIGKKGYVLDDVWEKCEQYHKGRTYSWHNEGHEEEEL
ncbi:hypothetical protein Tco_0133546 [Tanacetum coccineum]